MPVSSTAVGSPCIFHKTFPGKTENLNNVDDFSSSWLSSKTGLQSTVIVGRYRGNHDKVLVQASFRHFITTFHLVLKFLVSYVYYRNSMPPMHLVWKTKNWRVGYYICNFVDKLCG